jgi:hypothetical protein
MAESEPKKKPPIEELFEKGHAQAKAEGEAREKANGQEKKWARTGGRSAPVPQMPERLTIADLLALKVPKPEMLVQKLFPRRGLCIMVAAQKVGKTCMCGQLTMDLILGRKHFLQNYALHTPEGSEDTTGTVLIIEEDDPGGDSTFQDIFVRNNFSSEMDGLGFYRQAPFRLGPELIRWLEAEIARWKYKLIILDSYTVLRPEHSGRDIVKIERYEAGLLDALGKRCDCLIILIHHESITAKSNSQRPWADMGGGTHGLTGALESQMAITRFPNFPISAPERLVRVLGRHMESTAAVVRFILTTKTYELLLDGDAAEMYPLILQIGEAIEEEPFTPKAVRQAIGGSEATVTRQLAALFHAGVLIRSGFGNYLFTPNVKRLIDKYGKH